MTDFADDEWTEAVDADIPRVDLVGRAANGVPGFLLMKQEAGGHGLLDADFVRDLIAKSEPERTEDNVTMTGSPAAIAALIHGAPVRKTTTDDDEPVQVEKAKYDAGDLKRMANNGQAMADESYPIADEADLDRAIRAVGRGGADHDAIRRHIAARAKALGATAEIPDNWAADGSIKKAMADMPMDDGTDGMDPTVVLAEPDTDDAPGDPADPGSPAWEAIDAATARKWTSILARARTALGVMADRELMEAASADPDDADNAMDLQDAACAIDYAITVLAPFAIDEQAESDEGAMDAEPLGKALSGFDPSVLDTIEALAPVRKSGRALSAANETAIRAALTSLQNILASLPAAPATDDSGRPVAKTANEEPNMPQPTVSEDVTAESGQDPAMGAASPVPKPVAGAAVTDVAKAAKPTQVAIYDADGTLVGTVDPAEITMLTPAKAPAPAPAAVPDDDVPDADDDATDVPAPPAAPAAPPADMTPAPPATVGTPADATATDDDTNVAKAAPDDSTSTEAVLESTVQELLKAAIDDYSAGQADVVKSLETRSAEQAEVIKSLEEHNRTLEDRLAKVENAPAVMAIASNGAVPPAHLMRGQDRGAAPVALTKAQEMRDAFKASDDVTKQQVYAAGLNALAIDELAKIHAAGPR